MLFVCCQLLKYSRGLLWNWRCAFYQSIGSHRVTWEHNNPLRRFCCVSQATIPGTSWSMEPVCPWSYIWTLVGKNRLFLSKRGPKSKHWYRVEAQQTRTEKDLENQAITCADVQRARECSELLQESKWAEGLTGWEWTGHMYHPLMSHRSNGGAGSGPVLPPPGISS